MGLKRFWNKIFSNCDSVYDKICNLMCVCALVAGAFATVSTMTIGLPAVCIILSVVDFIIIIALSLIGFITKKTKLVSFLMTVIVGNVVIPLMFLTEGGLNGGMPYYLLLSPLCMVFTIRNKFKIPVFIFTLIEYSTLLYVAYKFPQYIIPIPNEQAVLSDIISNCVVTMLFIFLFSELFSKQFDADRNKIQKLSDMYCHQANTDELTGLFNRRFFNAILNTEVEEINSSDECKKSYIAMLDIDDFKKVNDTYGHQTGDKVLKGLADILISECNSSIVACRYGGEEFMVLIRNTDEDGACGIMQRISNTIKTQLHRGLINTNITVSCGLLEIKKNVPLNEVLETVDSKLYQAKNTGKDRIIK